MSVNEASELESPVEDSLRRIEVALSDRTELERTHQRAFDALYEEMRQYKEEFLVQAEKPLLLDLLLFYDSLSWFHQSLQREEMSPEVIADSFQYLIDEFLEVLYRRDVQPIDGPERFDRRLQKAVKVVAAEAPQDDQLVAQVLKRGFVRGGKVLRAEEVVLYRATEREDGRE